MLQAPASRRGVKGVRWSTRKPSGLPVLLRHRPRQVSEAAVVKASPAEGGNWGPPHVVTPSGDDFWQQERELIKKANERAANWTSCKHNCCDWTREVWEQDMGQTWPWGRMNLGCN